MDTLAQDQQQKDFMSTFFPPSIDHGHQHRDHSQHQQPLFNGAVLQPGLHGHGMHSMNTNNPNMTLDMDVMTNFMAMQGIESQQALSPTQAPYNPQLHLEQQFKVTQLQQLQQLQNQIFLQQVSKYFLYGCVWQALALRAWESTDFGGRLAISTLLISVWLVDRTYKWPGWRQCF
jgi:hypothetical protein